MRFLSASLVAVAAVLCVTPLSLRSTPGHSISLSVTVDSAEAAELNLPARPRTGGGRYSRYAASRLYDLYCDGPYVGGGFNGGTYYGGPWIDLRCYGAVH